MKDPKQKPSYLIYLWLIDICYKIYLSFCIVQTMLSYSWFKKRIWYGTENWCYRRKNTISFSIIWLGYGICYLRAPFELGIKDDTKHIHLWSGLDILMSNLDGHLFNILSLENAQLSLFFLDRLAVLSSLVNSHTFQDYHRKIFIYCVKI